MDESIDFYSKIKADGTKEFLENGQNLDIPEDFAKFNTEQTQVKNSSKPSQDLDLQQYDVSRLEKSINFTILLCSLTVINTIVILLSL